MKHDHTIFSEYDSRSSYVKGAHVSCGHDVLVALSDVPQFVKGGLSNEEYWKPVPFVSSNEFIPQLPLLRVPKGFFRTAIPTALIVMAGMFWLGFCACIMFGFHYEIIGYTLVATFFVLKYALLRIFGYTESPPYHYKDEKGYLSRCYHQCRSLLSQPAFWIGITCSFPLEHFLYEKVWPFYHISRLLGL